MVSILQRMGGVFVLKDERLQQITDMLKTNGKVEVSNLCRLFNVTEMTIRRDLGELADKKVAIRSHGGAILTPDNILSESPYEIRITHKLKEKQAIAKEALPFIKDGDRVFFDSSTTVYCLARLVNNAQKFLAVTDTLSTALELNARTDLKVVCLGGELKKTTGSCTGIFAENMLDTMHLNTAFIGLPNISPQGILSTSSTSELAIKRIILSHTDRVIVLADSSKLGPADFLSIGHLSEVSVLISDTGLPRDFVDYCNGLKNVQLLLVPVE